VIGEAAGSQQRARGVEHARIHAVTKLAACRPALQDTLHLRDQRGRQIDETVAFDGMRVVLVKAQTFLRQ
jgi:hypothetical protein